MHVSLQLCSFTREIHLGVCHIEQKMLTSTEQKSNSYQYTKSLQDVHDWSNC